MKEIQIQLYDKHTIEELPWPNTADGQYAKEFLEPFVRHQPSHYIHNIQATYHALLLDEHVLPICITDTEYENAYVCSPYTHYISYAKQELRMLQSSILRKSLSMVLSGLGRFLKASQINKVIHVNNWFVSTNLYPTLTAVQLRALHSFLVERYPDYTIIFRSLNDSHHEEMLEEFRKMDYKRIASRQIYLVHPADAPSLKAKARWLLKRDDALIERHGYEVLDGNQLSEQDIPRMVELYNTLYIQKYSVHNPQYNERFIALALKHQILHVWALRKNGRIDAVLGYFCRNGIMTTPFFGYDLLVPQETGLYRMLSALLFRIAEENGHVLNESSGAAQFKRNRGAKPAIEYSAIYDAHLPLRRRLCWTMLQTLINRIGIPLIRKYKL